MLGFHQKKVYVIFFFKSVETKMEDQKLLEDGENRLFLLSLVKEMKTTSEHLKIDAKFDILNIFKKYQTKYMFTCPISQFHHASGPSYCYLSNPSYPTPFQVHVHTYTYSFPARIPTLSRNNPGTRVIHLKNPVFLSPKKSSVSPKTLKVLQHLIFFQHRLY